MEGKCWIYKRATLYLPDNTPILIDYTDGTEPFDARIDMDIDGYPVYLWHIAAETIPIPLNRSRLSVTSIVKTGTIDTEDGQIKYEFIYGKYRPYRDYYLDQFIKWLPLILLLALLLK